MRLVICRFVKIVLIGIFNTLFFESELFLYMKIVLAKKPMSIEKKKVINYLNRIDSGSFKAYDDEKSILVVFKDSNLFFNLRQNVEKKMVGWGWYLISEDDNKYLFFQPNYTVYVNNVPSVLYHVSSSNKIGSILNRGLLPRGGKTWHSLIYPDRVYLLTSRNSVEDVVDLMGLEDYAVFRIDLDKINRNIKFYQDDYYKEAVWTYSHIPASAITYEGKN